MNWLMSFRLKTLTAALVPIVVGTALVFAQGFEVDWSVSMLALFGSLFIQIATNLFNDAIDFKKGTDTAERIGPQRVTQSGLISTKRVMYTAYFFLFLALLCGIPLVIKGGAFILLVGLFSLFLAYGYTGGPYPLSYLGLGDLFVILFFGIIAVMGVFYLHTEVFTMSSFIAGLQIGFLATVLIAINNLRDIKQDITANKKTIPVRFGIAFAKAEIYLLFLMSFILNIFWLFKGFNGVFFMTLLALPIVIKVVRGIKNNGPNKGYNKYLAQASMVHLSFGILFSIGLMV